MILGMKPNHTQHLSQRVSRANVLITAFFGEDPAYHSRDICILLFLQLDLSELVVSQMYSLSSLSLRKEPLEDILGYTVRYPIFGLQYRY